MIDGPALRVLVTGASGFVGGHLLPQLRQRLPAGSAVWGGGLAADGGERPEVAVDVTSASKVRELIAELRPDCCIHLAGVSHSIEAAQDEAAAWRTNLFGSLNLADALMAEAPACGLIHVSTSEVYGLSLLARPGGVDEGALLAPANVYAATKAAADLALGERALRGLRLVRFRPFNHTGPGQSPRLVVPYIASQIVAAERGERPRRLRLAAPEVKRDFLDVRDVCDAYVRAVLALPKLQAGAIYNLASGRTRSIRSIAEEMLALAGVAMELEAGGGEIRSHDVGYACGDARRALRDLGWRPAVPWEETLRSVLDDWRARPTLKEGAE